MTTVCWLFWWLCIWRPCVRKSIAAPYPGPQFKPPAEDLNISNQWKQAVCVFGLVLVPCDTMGSSGSQVCWQDGGVPSLLISRLMPNAVSSAFKQNYTDFFIFYLQLLLDLIKPPGLTSRSAFHSLLNMLIWITQQLIQQSSKDRKGDKVQNLDITWADVCLCAWLRVLSQAWAHHVSTTMYNRKGYEYPAFIRRKQKARNWGVTWRTGVISLQ